MRTKALLVGQIQPKLVVVPRALRTVGPLSFHVPHLAMPRAGTAALASVRFAGAGVTMRAGVLGAPGFTIAMLASALDGQPAAPFGARV